MSENSLARAHRRIASWEHGLERRLLAMAPKLGDPPAVRRRAHRLSAQADDHQRTADRIDDDPAQP